MGPASRSPRRLHPRREGRPQRAALGMHSGQRRGQLLRARSVGLDRHRRCPISPGLGIDFTQVPFQIPNQNEIVLALVLVGGEQLV